MLTQKLKEAYLWMKQNHSSDILNVSSAFDRCVLCYEYPFRRLLAWDVYHVLALCWGLGSILQRVSILVNMSTICVTHYT